MLRVPYDELSETFQRILLKLQFQSNRAHLCARLFADASRDGVASHGLNRFPQFVRMIQKGLILVDAEPALVASFGALERWDGNSGWQAADAGVIGACWTNTHPNLPPWGASDPRVGNNPLIIAVPRPQGHVVLDMATSQFSYRALASHRLRGEQLPVEGGFDSAGRLTKDPAAIEATRRPLPIGYWKGSGLALLLDMLAGLLSGGLFTHQIAPDPERETKLSQVFIAFDISSRSPADDSARLVDEIIDHFHSPPPPLGPRVRYPVENVLQTRKENLASGVPVEPEIWRQVQALSASL